MSDASPSSASVYRDPSFVGMLITQFLGAFNDNFYKQMVLFVCVDLASDDRANAARYLTAARQALR